MNQRLRIATRRSALAMWQAQHVTGLLKRRHPKLEVELVPIVTRGDRIIDRPLTDVGGKGLFLKELELAMLDGKADLAVHSLKDVPAEMTPGLALEVALPRANPFDAWVTTAGKGIDELPAGSRVGTSSLRRQCQLRARRADLEVAPLRGNVDTRLKKLAAGEYDAVILACAGLERLGFADQIYEVLEPPRWLPAPTQGIIGLQCRSDDDTIRGLIAPLADAGATAQARAERAAARVLEGSCQVPLAVYAEPRGGMLRVQALVGTPDGSRLIRASRDGELEDPRAVGEAVAARLLQQGAGEIIARLQAASADRAP